MLLRGWPPVLLSALDGLRQKVWIYIASQVCVLCGLHSLPLPLLTLDCSSCLPPFTAFEVLTRWGSTASGRRCIGVACTDVAGLLQHCCRLRAEAEETTAAALEGADTSAFRSDLITSSSVALHFCSVSFSKQTPEQASRVVNPNDFCSHLKADALKCELSQLLSQRVSLDMEFGCVYYSRLLAVKTINLYLCNTCQTR